MNEKPIIKAKVVFLSRKEGGMPQMPIVGGVARYSPHLVVQDSNVRKVIIGANNVIKEDYLCIDFLSGPSQIKPDEAGIYEISLIYYPSIKYEKLVKGATFTIREGRRIVGFGEVLER